MNYCDAHFAMKCNSYIKQRTVIRAITLVRGFQPKRIFHFLKNGIGTIEVSFWGNSAKTVTYFYISSPKSSGVFLYPKGGPKLDKDYECEVYHILLHNIMG